MKVTKKTSFLLIFFTMQWYTYRYGSNGSCVRYYSSCFAKYKVNQVSMQSTISAVHGKKVGLTGFAKLESVCEKY